MSKYIDRLGLEVEYSRTSLLSKQDPPAAELNTLQPLVMRDRVKLYADAFRPHLKEKVPAILVYRPYCKRGGWWNGNLDPVLFGADPAALSGLHAFDSPDPGWWIDQDYAVVYVDAAGTSQSEGDQPFMGIC
jgi:predicted acyl esterase